MLRIGDLLVKAQIINKEQLKTALEFQQEHGGRLGDILVKLGSANAERISDFLNSVPNKPLDIDDLGLEFEFLVDLFIKQIYVVRASSMRQFAENMKLPSRIIADLIDKCTARNYLMSYNSADSHNYGDLRYTLSELGIQRAKEALGRSRYVGPTPVSLDAFVDRINLQKTTNETFSISQIKNNLNDLEISDDLLMKIGPALNSGRAILLYGPAGNGKTSVALSVAKLFQDMVYIPYAVVVDGDIFRVFDPRHHKVIDPASTERYKILTSLSMEDFDIRWMPCERPFVIAGGEMTIDMLEINFDEQAFYYEAPLHIKALGGCFVIDDFGRQQARPEELLNRWIVPMERRVDYLKFKSGKTFAIPFEVMLIFSTNIEPAQLMDEAFLRRLPYKIKIDGPSVEQFKRIFHRRAAASHLDIKDDDIMLIIDKITKERGHTLAAFQPGFIIDQIMSNARFFSERYEFNPQHIESILDNLLV